MSETVKWDKCHGCGGSVAVKVNRSNRAYYRCDHCGIKVEHTWTKTSDKYLVSIGAASEPVPAPKPTPKKAAETTETPPPPPPKRGAGLLLD